MVFLGSRSEAIRSRIVRSTQFVMSLSALCIALCWGQAVQAQVSGTVIDNSNSQPIVGAIVKLQGTSISALTDGSGNYSLPSASGSNLVVVAAARGYYNSPAVISTPLTGNDYSLTPVAQTNDPNYIWKENSFCGVCHPDQLADHDASPMGKTATNAWVYDLYNGTGTLGGLNGFTYVNDSVHAATFPQGECASCHQPQRWMASNGTAALDDINNMSVDGAAGISCDFCHKVASVSNIKSLGYTDGDVTVTRPTQAAITTQVMYGALGDVDYIISDAMNPSYNPGLRHETCAVCHEYNSDPDHDQDTTEPGSIPGQTTYSEWANSPYGDPASGMYQDCVTCHMAEATYDGCIVDPVVRESGQIREHDILGTTADFLDEAVTMTVNVQQVGSEVVVDVDITNDKTGHKVPTGITLRNMILVVEAKETSSGNDLVSTGTQVVHNLGGVGDPALGYYAGLPGKYFSYVLENALGQAPVIFTEATAIQFDTRIAPLATDSTNYSFSVPAAGGDVEVNARLIYRRAYRSLLDTKGWTTTGTGGPLEDIVAPHFGHLMEQSIVVVNTQAGDNNDCAFATPITDGDTPYDNTGATTDGPDEAGTCGKFGYTQIDSDIWYRYTATCQGDVTVSLCGSGYDTKLAVYDGVACPPGAAPVACNDDTCGLQSEVTFTAVFGNEYLIRIGGYQGATGTGNINISCAGTVPMMGDTCSVPLVIGEGVHNGTLTGRTNGGSASCGSSAGNEDAWYEFTASCTGTLFANTCGTNDMGGQDAGVDTVLAAFSDCSGSEIICNDDWGGGTDPTACDGVDLGNSYDSGLMISVNSGDTVYLRVSKFGGGALGDFLLNVTMQCDCQPPLGLSCTSNSANINLAWTNGESYSSISILRDGVSIATLSGTATSYIDTGVAQGTYTYTVEGDCNPGTAGVSCGITHNPPVGPQFVRSDCNASGSTDLADAVFLLGTLFPAGAANNPSCDSACDCNDDGILSIADAICTLGTLFSVPAVIPAAPYPACGIDPTADSLDCLGFSPCP